MPRRVWLLGGALLLAAGAPLLVACFLPSRWEVARERTIAAPRARIHALVEDLRRWPGWAAWAARDPTAEARFEGPARGVGATLHWHSADEGRRSLTITASDPERGVWFDLLHEGRFDAKGAIQYRAAGAATRVTWTEAGEVGSSPLARLIVPFLDAALGGDFERGLARLAELAEAGAEAEAEER